MCLLILANRVFPRDEVLEAAQRGNSDGIGVAWIEGKKVHWEKGLTLAELKSITTANVLPFPLLIHFRAASSGMGGNDPKLCHPFPINRVASLDLKGSTRALLAHNGNWHKWETVYKNLPWTPPGGAWSDTRAMAWIGGLASNKQQAFEFFEKTDQKLLYFSSREVKRFGTGWCHDEENDIFYSYDIEASLKRSNSWSSYSSNSSHWSGYDFSDKEEEDAWIKWWVESNQEIPGPGPKKNLPVLINKQEVETHLNEVGDWVNNVCGTKDLDELSLEEREQVLKKIHDMERQQVN